MRSALLRAESHAAVYLLPVQDETIERFECLGAASVELFDRAVRSMKNQPAFCRMQDHDNGRAELEINLHFTPQPARRAYEVYCTSGSSDDHLPSGRRK